MAYRRPTEQYHGLHQILQGHGISWLHVKESKCPLVYGKGFLVGGKNKEHRYCF